MSLVQNLDSENPNLTSDFIDVFIHHAEVFDPLEIIEHLLEAEFVEQVSPSEILVVIVHAVIEFPVISVSTDWSILCNMEGVDFLIESFPVSKFSETFWGLLISSLKD